MAPTDPMSPDQLTTHEPFLRRLARALVSDGSEADDLVQDAYAAALERPADAPGNLRAWMAGVVRNKARMGFRSRARRLRRESTASRSERTPATVDLLAKEEVRQRVLAAVLALPDAYREVILLRYMEDQPPRHIAQALEVPVETVRTRLWRARDRLRQDLDREGGGKAGAGLALLAPWLASGGSSAPAAGAIALGAVALALLAGVLVWRPWAGPASEPTDGMPAQVADGVDPPGPGLQTQGEAPAPEPAPAAPAAPHVESPAHTLHGRVTYYVTGASSGPVEPPAGSSIRVFAATPRRAFVAQAATVPTSIHAGRWTGPTRFEVANLPAGPYVIEIRAPGFVTGRSVALAGSASRVAHVLMQGLPGGVEDTGAAAHAVRVVDRQGRPVEGARVTCHVRTGRTPHEARTDAEGKARFEALPYLRHDAGGGHATPGHDIAFGFVTAAKDGLVARQVFGVWRHTVARELPPLVLDEPGLLQGRLLLPEGMSARGITVRATALIGKSGMWGPRGTPVTSVTHEARVADDGMYRFPGLPPGSYYLTLGSDRGLRVDRRHATLGTDAGRREDPRAAAYARRIAGARGHAADNAAPRQNDKIPIQVAVAAGKTTERDLAILAGVTLEGVVRPGPGGGGLAGATVDIEFAPHDRLGAFRDPSPDGVPAELLGRSWPPALRNPLSWLRMRTDSRGRYRVHGLAPEGRYFVRVHPHAGHAFDQRFVATGRPGSLASVTHDVVPAGSAALLVRTHVGHALRHADDDRSAYAFRPPYAESGLVQVDGLRPGTWQLLAFDRRGSKHMPEVARFVVQAGETTTVDAIDGGDCLVSGVVTRRGVAVPGALVWSAVKASRVLTDDEGRFSMRFPSAVDAFGFSLLVEPPEPNAPRAFVRLDTGRRGIPPDWSWDGAIELPRGRLQVEVRDTDGRPVPSARLDVRRIGDLEPGRIGTHPWAGTTDAQGRAVISGVLMDGCLLTATLPGSARVLRRWIDEDPDEHVDVLLQAGAPTRVLVRVVDGDGEPRAKVRVGGRFWEQGMPRAPGDARIHQLGRMVPATGQMLTDERGEALLEGLGAGHLELFASVRGAHVQEVHTLEAGEERTIELVLEPR